MTSSTIHELDRPGEPGSRAIAALSETLAAADSPGDALRRALELVIDITCATTGAFVLDDAEGYTIAAAHDAHGAALPDVAELLSDTVVNDVLVGRATICVPDVPLSDRYAKVPSLVSMSVHSVVCVPMTVGSRVLGALYLGKRGASAGFTAQQVRELTVLAAMAVPFLAQLRRASAPRGPAFDGLLGESPAMTDVRRLIERIGPTDLSVLIVGETGTGKELTAKAIHGASRRSDRPLVATNCSAVAEGVLEAELFGCKKGAFTGAVSDREGRIEAASGSTLFLDEVADMSLGMQAALLRVLQEKEVVRLGENRPRPVDFRLVAATNKDLAAEVAAGRFREDLLFRLREVVVSMPPLRARGDDILLLARLFLRQCETQLALPVHSLSKGSERVLSQHTWPGNVRELRSTMRRAAVLADGLQIGPDALALSCPPNNREDASEMSGAAADLGDLDRTLAEARDDFVERFVAAVLEREGGCREAAAAKLGISVRSLYRHQRGRAHPSRSAERARPADTELSTRPRWPRAERPEWPS